MARRTATDLINEVRDNAGGETSETLSDSRILRLVNEEYKTLCAKYTPQQIKDAETVTTANGTAAYELAQADILQIEDVFDTTNDLYLKPISEYQYNTWVQGNATGVTGTPIYWFISGVGANGRTELTFYPTPDGTYSITVGYYEFTDLVTSPAATSPITPMQFDNVIVNRASAQALRQPFGFTERLCRFRGTLTVPTDGGEICQQVGMLDGIYQRQRDQAYRERQQDHSRESNRRLCIHGLYLSVLN